MAPNIACLNTSDASETLSDHEHFNCYFPASVGIDCSADPSDFVAKKLPLLDKDNSKTRATAEFSSAVGVAWALTLQCFVIADVFIFAWQCVEDASRQSNGPLHAREHHRLCSVRVDQDDTISSFLRSFSSAPPPSTSKVMFSSEQRSRHQYNTSVVIESAPAVSNEREFTSSPALQADLNLNIFQSDTSPSIARLDYRTCHTSNNMALSVLETFRHILTQILCAPSDMYVHEIDRCPQEHRSLIKNSTALKGSVVNRCLHDMILEQCERRPHNLAVFSTERSFTYGKLNELSAKLALHLQKLGLQPETFVMCLFRKSAWNIVARLAILRAGAAYISVNANYPPPYLGSVLQQTDAQMFLTDEASATIFESALPHMVILSNELFESLESPANNIICAKVAPDNACLVLFSSGSTGKPKGIVQTHRAYASGITKYAQDLDLSDDTRYLQFDDYAFDISNIEFLAPLIVGGCCVVPDDRITNIRDLVSEINNKQANIVFLVPSMAIKLDPADVPHLRNLCIGGEPLYRDLIAKWKESKTRLLCQYGMSEAAVCSALNTNLSPLAANVIGQASTGAIWIADPLSIHKPMPVGSCGEIIIEGPHLARGYLDPAGVERSDAGFLKTQPSWIMKMHQDKASTTQLYRSGDLGRLNFDGTISYLGRKDTVVKVHGIKVDAQEVEQLAQNYLSPEDTIIVDLLGESGSNSDPILTAIFYFEDGKGSREGYSGKPSGNVTFRNGSLDPVVAPKVEVIQRTIGQSVPPFMVPKLYLVIDTVPRTSSKKIDRKKIRQCAQTWYMEALEKSRNGTAKDIL